MTYQEMRTLCERLARYDGRLTVLSVRSQEPWTQWSVCLRDHVHETWMCCGLLDQFTAYAQGASPRSPGGGAGRERAHPAQGGQLRNV